MPPLCVCCSYTTRTTEGEASKRDREKRERRQPDKRERQGNRVGVGGGRKRERLER